MSVKVITGDGMVVTGRVRSGRTRTVGGSIGQLWEGIMPHYESQILSERDRLLKKKRGGDTIEILIMMS